MSPSITNPSRFYGVGVEWSDHLQDAILERLDEVSLIELIPENFFDGRHSRFLKAIAKKGTPVMIHGVELSIGSDEPIKESHLDAMLAIADQVNTINFGDHLCFTEMAGIEIGQLTPLPLTQEAVDAVCRKIEQVQKRIQVPLLVETITNRFQIPLPEMSEPAFMNAVCRTSGARLLLDLNNLHTNATNFGFDPYAWLSELDFGNVLAVHLAGGMLDKEGDLVDSHNRAVPAPVWDLFRHVTRRVRPACTIVEWTDDPPPFSVLLEDVFQARAILKETT